MQSTDHYIKQVASQMMRSGSPGRLLATAEEKEIFLKKYEGHIKWTLKHLPKCSSAIAAVVVKAFIKYPDRQKVAKFCRALELAYFTGPNDPVRHLWNTINRANPSSREDSSKIYRKAVTAIVAYMEDRVLNELRPRLTDLFDWEEGFRLPLELGIQWDRSLPDKYDFTKES